MAKCLLYTYERLISSNNLFPTAFSIVQTYAAIVAGCFWCACVYEREGGIEGVNTNGELTDQLLEFQRCHYISDLYASGAVADAMHDNIPNKTMLDQVVLKKKIISVSFLGP